MQIRLSMGRNYKIAPSSGEIEFDNFGGKSNLGNFYFRRNIATLILKTLVSSLHHSISDFSSLNRDSDSFSISLLVIIGVLVELFLVTSSISVPPPVYPVR
ncbi:hypothetical protein RJT34_02735 [Clitoria ternatea]|uniref:Uncharacterized protein n=1 Tax=Clitoria ternatea TaxID=43366 RepID=A0AAN9KKS7_CLITE